MVFPTFINLTYAESAIILGPVNGTKILLHGSKLLLLQLGHPNWNLFRTEGVSGGLQGDTLINNLHYTVHLTAERLKVTNFGSQITQFHKKTLSSVHKFRVELTPSHTFVLL